MKSFTEEVEKIKESLSKLSNIDLNISGLTEKQIILLTKGNLKEPKQLQSYTAKINQIQYADISRFNPKEQGLYQALQYNSALKDIEDSQAALLLSTQGVTNAQIRQTLAVRGVSDAQQYNAMIKAVLLTSKKSLEYAELQNIITTQVGNETYAKAIMNHMGLTVTTNGEGVEITKLTSKKLQELVATGLLTESQAQQIAIDYL